MATTWRIDLIGADGEWFEIPRVFNSVLETIEVVGKLLDFQQQPQIRIRRVEGVARLGEG